MCLTILLKVTGNVEHIYLEDTRKKTLNSFCYAIHLRPTVILHNSLPLPLYILTCGAVNELIVPPGASRYLSSVEPGAAYVVLKVMAVSLLFCSKNYGTDGKQINAVELERYSS